MPGTFDDDLTAQITKAATIKTNPLANFSYKSAAYANDDADGHSDYDPTRDNNIPLPTPSALDTNATVLSEGFRSQASSLTRNLMNHFFGRMSYNLNKAVDIVHAALTSLKSFLGQPNGFASLDAQGRVPYSQLPESAMEFKGFWAANTNTPVLADGVGTNGDMYVVSVAGTQDLGSGPISFLINDRVIYSGDTHTWGRIPAGDVTSVNNIQPVDGNVTLPVFTGATQNDGGAQGLVPAPSAGDQAKFLSGDGTWKTIAAGVIDAVYPVGSLYWTATAPANGGDPNVLFPGTYWTRLKDCVIRAAGDSDPVDDTKRGQDTVTIGTTNLPKHTHGLNDHQHSLVHGSDSCTAVTTGTYFDSALSTSKTLLGYLRVRNIEDVGPAVEMTQGFPAGDMLENYTETGNFNGADIEYSLGNHTNIIIDARHSHSLSGYTGKSLGNTTDGGFSNTALNVKNKYLARYCWQRIAPPLT